jgi:hypothetical protein
MAEAKRELPEHLKKSRGSKVAHIAAEFGTVDRIPASFVFSSTKDEKSGALASVCLLDGTHVTNDDLTQALDAALKDPDPDPEIVALAQAAKGGEKGKK